MLDKARNILAAALLALLPLLSLGIAHAAVGTNLVVNPSAETLVAGQPANWSQGGWGTNTRSLTVSSDAHTGVNSLQATISSYTDGDAKWYADPVSVSANTSYTYSDFYKSDVPTELVAQNTDTSGNVSYQWLATVVSSSTWAQASTTFTTPSSAATTSIFHVLNSVGTLQIDDASLGAYTVDPPVSNGNIVPNPSLETAAGAIPAGWSTGRRGTNSTTFSYLNSGHTGTRSAKVQMTSYTDGDAKWTFPAQAVLPSRQYQFTDWYQSSVDTEVFVGITKTDGSTQYISLGSPIASTAWVKFSSSFSLPSNAAYATVFHVLHSVGYLVTDDYSLSVYTPTGFNRGLVTLTFDDGWTSIYTNGLPLLKKYSIPSTQYIVSGFLNDPYEPEYMTNAQVKAFITAGHEVGSHTVTHPDLTTLTGTKLRQELVSSKNRLTTITGKSVTNIASPYGSYNSAVILAMKAAGYKSHRSVEPGFNSKDSLNVYDIKVQNIESNTTVAQVKAWVDQALASKTWLVLVYHQVDTNPAAGEYNTLPSDLDAELSYIKSTGITAKTLQQALSELTPQL